MKITLWNFIRFSSFTICIIYSVFDCAVTACVCKAGGSCTCWQGWEAAAEGWSELGKELVDCATGFCTFCVFGEDCCWIVVVILFARNKSWMIFCEYFFTNFFYTPFLNPQNYVTFKQLKKGKTKLASVIKEKKPIFFLFSKHFLSRLQKEERRMYTRKKSWIREFMCNNVWSFQRGKRTKNLDWSASLFQVQDHTHKRIEHWE